MRTLRRTLAALVVAAAAIPLPTAAPAQAALGSLDPSFGARGVAKVDTGAEQAWATAIARQPDGKLVAVGTKASPGGNPVLVVRLLPNGLPDPTFATNGVFSRSMPDELAPTAVAIQGDGGIVVSLVGTGVGAHVDLIRITPAGSLDTGFGRDGLVTGPAGLITNAALSGMALQPDGKILVTHGSGFDCCSSVDMVVRRHNPDGSLDATFGTGGIATADFSGLAESSEDWGMAVSVAPSGRIVVGGWTHGETSSEYTGYTGFALAAFTPAGALDPTFGTGGLVLTPFPGREATLLSLVAAADGSVYAAGRVYDPTHSQFVVTKYTAAGALDPTFGAGGVVTVMPPGFASKVDTGTAIALDPAGGVVAAGWRFRPGGTNIDLVVTRLQANGTPRPGFGGGMVVMQVNAKVQDRFGVIADPTGQVFVANDVDDRFAVIKFRSGTSAASTGWNVVGQLGTGTNVDAHVLTAAPALVGAESVSTGIYHGLAVKGDGSLWSFGWNGVGQLGDGTTIDRWGAVPVAAGGSPFRAVATGAHHSLALTEAGVVWSSGWNVAGMLGDGTTVDRHAFAPIGLSDVVAISAGAFHSLALKADGMVWAWGWNPLGQLGDGTTTDRSTPTQVPGLTGVTAIAGGWYHSVALKADGTVWTWGWNGVGQLGDGTTTDRHAPVQVPGLTGITSIASGAHHVLAVTGAKTARAWGWNAFGQLGDGSITDRHTPVAVAGLTNVATVAGGGYHSLASTTDGSLRAWGWNTFGQLGTGGTFDAHVPTLVTGNGAIAVAAGLVQSLVIQTG